MKIVYKGALVWVCWGIVVLLGVLFWRIALIILIWFGGMWMAGKMSDDLYR